MESYDEPHDSHQPALPRARSPKVFGILSIVFASITLLLSMFSIVASLGAHDMARIGVALRRLDSPAQAELLDRIMSSVGGIYDVAAINSAIFAVMSAALLAIGIGQVQYRRWARAASVSWAVAALVSLVVMSILFVTMIGPVYDEIASAAATLGGANPEVRAILRTQSFGPVASAGGAIAMVLFFAPYPILLWAFFTRPIVKRSMIT